MIENLTVEEQSYLATDAGQRAIRDASGKHLASVRYGSQAYPVDLKAMAQRGLADMNRRQLDAKAGTVNGITSQLSTTAEVRNAALRNRYSAPKG
jgi:hypothetical protein